MLYFAYGSNMNWDEMRERCPYARVFVAAVLRAHKLAFTRESDRRGCGVADAVPQDGSEVWGVVDEITDKKDKKPLIVYAYFAEREPNPALPNSEYKGLIVSGAKYWHLPDDYISQLEAIKGS
jgi:hypothetical protein